jgi:hypothetical protein
VAAGAAAKARGASAAVAKPAAINWRRDSDMANGMVLNSVSAV